MLFDFSLQKKFTAFELDVSLQSDSPNIAIVGASGSGKTLTLNMLAGLLKADSGYIRIQGEQWFDGKRHLPPQERRVGLVFQDYALFPHLTVAQNIAFGLNRGLANPKQKHAQVQAASWLERMQLSHVAAHYPSEISGGQKQRTALARALANRPKLLLLDEPFSALDTDLRGQMRQEVGALAREQCVPLILITHDTQDAEALADQIWRMEAGRLMRVN
ncbi:sulfate/molybdate ABC transporter ATP-binding protein [Neisseria wadsworthii]|uniref:Molybdate ABC superfamily ATP binding cassette transporter, ABC protein n=1 Tax=Neisseria wadsworthii 9715 TaxID=1030841 RepID=G4CRR9_9NEIS|nr:ABC transporter ATP-binding protein [Neisseria wadsworthii]EGZ45220.1 molybdate ABC superfamily ATP binding cassette transporter, ABC protein [Neisseria wadsworthii 9715]QMT35453.1 ABC transporter ATP-binding protein [Neisseria wadsworthii]